jgi:hypothetical protein
MSKNGKSNKVSKKTLLNDFCDDNAAETLKRAKKYVTIKK